MVVAMVVFSLVLSYSRKNDQGSFLLGIEVEGKQIDTIKQNLYSLWD
jgi:hypothetical protein